MVKARDRDKTMDRAEDKTIVKVKNMSRAEGKTIDEVKTMDLT